ncbi:MAG TPA: 3-deoxy-D-manno-octulosonic acid transferase [Bacteroidetes bacterium]|nr:3-deoxy-D-manno-octulosonic acid transferase [Bacteroidota bacterium]
MFGIRLAAIRSEKARAWIEGRKRWRERMPAPKSGIRYWFHCASLGEFEQARPLIERYQKEGIEICLSFFSPSGYESRKNYALASWVGYLPMDGPRVAKDFMRLMDADQVFFVKYEFWYFFLMEIKARKLPAYLISARFRPEQPFFKWYGSLHRQMLHTYTRIFTQDQTSVDLLKRINVKQVQYAGDTRFDRVIQLPRQRQTLPVLEHFCKDHFTVIAGSSWPEEEELIEKAIPYFPDMRWVLVPHDISENHIMGMEDRFKGNFVRYSALEQGKAAGEASVLIVDKMGLLVNVYPYGQVAFVGGGFSNALHNILEAAVWGMPVMYGNHIEKYPEGQELAEAGGGNSIGGLDDLLGLLREWQDEKIRNLSGEKAIQWIEENVGATERILGAIDGSTATQKTPR